MSEESAAHPGPAGSSNPSDESGSTPLVVIKGDASPEEVAALLAVVQAVAARSAERPATPRSLWAAPARRLRRPLTPGPDGWRASARPG